MQDFRILGSSSSIHIAFDGSSDCEAGALYVSLESRVMLAWETSLKKNSLM